MNASATLPKTLIVNCEERQRAYERVHLSEYLGERNADSMALGDGNVYLLPGVELRLNERVSEIDRRAREVLTSQGRYRYDKLVLATGSFPFVPPIAGAGDDALAYRTLDDLDRIRDTAAQGARRGVVIGGGRPHSPWRNSDVRSRRAALALSLPPPGSGGELWCGGLDGRRADRAFLSAAARTAVCPGQPRSQIRGHGRRRRRQGIVETREELHNHRLLQSRLDMQLNSHLPAMEFTVQSRALNQPPADGLGSEIERSVLDILQAQTEQMQRAKRLLMKTQQLSEPAAHARLQQAAMDSGRPLLEIARQLLETHHF